MPNEIPAHLRDKVTTSQGEVRYLKTAEIRAAVSDDGKRTLTGLIPYNTLSEDMGGWYEKISPGAFADAFEAGADVRCLYEHDPKCLLGRTSSGTLTITDSDDGLRWSCELPNTTVANNLIESLNRRDITGGSFGFICEEADWVFADAIVVRTLLKVSLYEVSAVSDPAYTDSALALRSCPAEIRSKIGGQAPETRAADACACSCDACTAGNCDDCSNEDCDDDLCDCDDDLDEERTRNYMHMTLTLRRLGL